MSLILVTAPTVEPLTPDEMRARVPAVKNLSDAALTSIIKAARQQLDGPEGAFGRALITQTWDLTLDGFPWIYNRRYDPCNEILIPLPPLQEIVSVTYTDPDGAPQTLDPAKYVVTYGAPSYLSMVPEESWPATKNQRNVVVIRFIAGYGPFGASVPEPIRAWISLQASNLNSLTERSLFTSREEIPGVMTETYTVGAGAADMVNNAKAALEQQYRVYL